MKLKRLFICLFPVFLFSCVSGNDVKDSRTVFSYNEAAGISSLDPAFAKDLSNIWACNQLFNGLVQLNDEMEIIPCIAKRWEIKDGGKEYRFILRKDVRFHDNPCFENSKGRIVNANDFVYSFMRIVDEKVVSPGLWVFNHVEINDQKYSFSAPNDTTFIIRLKEPFPPFLGILSMKYCSVVPKEAVDYYGADFRKNPVGTGPFYFKLWKENKKLIFRKNTHYFEYDNGHQLPYLDAISISFLVDKQSAFLQFVQKKLDFMSGIDASYKDELLTKNGTLKPKYKDQVQLVSQPYLNTEYLGILVDLENPLLKDNPLQYKEVRQAVNYGFDRIKMIKYLRNNIGEPGLQGIIPKGLPSFLKEERIGYDYAPGKAKSLLKLRGYDSGNPAKIKLVTNAEYLDLCKYIQYQLNEIGFEVAIEVNPPAALREMKAQSKVSFFRASWIADYPDAENYLSLFYSKNFCPKGPNYTHFKNAEFDKLYELSLKEVNVGERNTLYRKMDKLIMEEAPVVILYYDQVLRFSQKNISGLGSNAINLLDLKKVRKVNE